MKPQSKRDRLEEDAFVSTNGQTAQLRHWWRKGYDTAMLVKDVGPYSYEVVEGQQHDTGRVTFNGGSFFANTASPEDAQLIADALNAYQAQS